jgi:ribosome maturation factor RimP
VRVTETQLDAVRAAVEPAVHALGFDVYDLELLGGAGARTLRVTVTAASGTVDLDAITAVTQAVSPLVDRADAIHGAYLLEVSSPGVERTLRLPTHYAGAVGEQVSVKYHTPAGPRRVRGVLSTVDADRLAVEEDGVRVEIPLADVTHARTVFEWGPPPRPPSPKTSGGKTRGRAKERR